MRSNVTEVSRALIAPVMIVMTDLLERNSGAERATPGAAIETTLDRSIRTFPGSLSGKVILPSSEAKDSSRSTTVSRSGASITRGEVFSAAEGIGVATALYPRFNAAIVMVMNFILS